jgi:hypothetical protein
MRTRALPTHRLLARAPPASARRRPAAKDPPCGTLATGPHIHPSIHPSIRAPAHQCTQYVIIAIPNKTKTVATNATQCRHTGGVNMRPRHAQRTRTTLRQHCLTTRCRWRTTACTDKHRRGRHGCVYSSDTLLQCRVLVTMISITRKHFRDPPLPRALRCPGRSSVAACGPSACGGS